MTAGGGIEHSEMRNRTRVVASFCGSIYPPMKNDAALRSWNGTNAGRKDEGMSIHVIAGETARARSPVTQIAAQPIYFDVELAANRVLNKHCEHHAALVFVVAGEISIQGTSTTSVIKPACVLGSGTRLKFLLHKMSLR
jgi:redox-sensitive bicupin YhaK (pirin superfamily)